MKTSRRQVLVGSLAGLGASLGSGLTPLTLPQQGIAFAYDGEVADNPNVVRALNAAYEMRILSTGEIFGHEHWTLFVLADGTRTLSVRMINNDFNLFRTIIHRVDERFRPLECHLNYYRSGQRMGSAWFRTQGKMMTAAADLPSSQVSQEIPVPDHFSMVNHAASAEGWHFWYCPKDGAVHDATLYNLRVGAADSPSGVLGRVHTRWIQFLGEDETETPAGSFACDRYAFGDASRIWVFGEDRMPVRLRFAEADREFVISEWRPWT